MRLTYEYLMAYTPIDDLIAAIEEDDTCTDDDPSLCVCLTHRGVDDEA